MARERCACGYASARSASEIGMAPASPTPTATRAVSSAPKERAAPPAAVATLQARKQAASTVARRGLRSARRAMCTPKQAPKSATATPPSRPSSASDSFKSALMGSNRLASTWRSM